MMETFKNRLILILVIITVTSLIFGMGSCSEKRKLLGLRESEMSKRLDAEEKLSKFSQDKLVLEEKIKAKEKELQDEKAAHGATKKALTQEQLVNQSLKEELDKVTKLKEALEEDLKEALVNSKAKQQKK